MAMPDDESKLGCDRGCLVLFMPWVFFAYIALQVFE